MEIRRLVPWLCRNFPEEAEIRFVTAGLSEKSKIAPCQNISDRFKGKKWLVLIRPPLAGFESTADKSWPGRVKIVISSSQTTSITGLYCLPQPPLPQA